MQILTSDNLEIAGIFVSVIGCVTAGRYMDINFHETYFGEEAQVFSNSIEASKETTRPTGFKATTGFEA